MFHLILLVHCKKARNNFLEYIVLCFIINSDMDIFLWNEPQENIKNEIIFNNLKSWTRDYIFQPLFSSNYGDNFIYLAENLINTYWLKLSTDFTSFFLKKYSISLIVSCYIFVDSNSSIDAGFFISFSIILFVFYSLYFTILFQIEMSYYD